jgi:hypothetical protein
MPINKLIRHVNLSVLAAVVCLGISVLTSAGAEAATRTQVQRWIVEEARQTRVPASLALAIAKVESNFQDSVLGQAGERGVMQIMPATAKGEFGVNAERLWDGQLNVKLGINYLERLYNQYGNRWDLALSHYNGGTLKGRGANAIPHSYTRKYVADVMRWWVIFQRRNVVAKLEPIMQVANAEEPVGDPSVDYWMFDDPEVEKGWRHYVDVANYWLKPEEDRARIDAERHNRAHEPNNNAYSTNLADRLETHGSWNVDGWGEMLLSDRLKQETNRLRRNFRRYIRGQKNRWHSLPFGIRTYGETWMEESSTGHHPKFL